MGDDDKIGRVRGRVLAIGVFKPVSVIETAVVASTLVDQIEAQRAKARHGADQVNQTKQSQRASERAEWQAEADRLRQINPSLSDEQVFQRVGSRFKRTARTIRTHCH